MRTLRSHKLVLDAVGLALAAVLFAAATSLRPPWWNLCLGIGTSFVFITISDLLTAGQKRLLDASRVRFFGRELVRGETTFVYPDFEPHEEVTRVLEANGVRMKYQRPSSRTRPFIDFWIDAPFTAASNDLEAILYVAGIFGGLATAPDALITDRRVVKACNRSFITFGLGSNACTYLYFDHAAGNALFELRRESAGVAAEMYVRTVDGREFHSDDHNQYGLIARYAPDRLNHPDRRWFFVAGLGPAGTVGAAWYLAQNWRYLAKNIPAGEDFAAFVSVPVIAPTSAYLKSADVVVMSPGSNPLSSASAKGQTVGTSP
jgi:hypothetical protein